MHTQSQFRALPLGSVTPLGWLHAQLEIQANGLTGSIESLWPDLGPESGWLGGPGESWERGPYYLDGLVPLAYVLNDRVLIDRSQKWIEWMLASQTDDGQFGPRGNDDWWPRMVAVKVLQQYEEATGDERVTPFLERYFSYQLGKLPEHPLHGWAAARAAENVLVVAWLHERAPRQEWLELTRLLLRQGLDWETFLARDLITGRAMSFNPMTHGPNVAMGLKNAAVRTLMLGDEHGHARTLAALDQLDRWHGQVHGLFSGDEWLAGREPTRGVETCQVVEFMFTMELAARTFGETHYGDLLELAAYNLLPASSDPLMRAHQYHQQANQIEASIADRDWSYSTNGANVFGLEPHFGCCTANYHQGWPKFVSSMWARAEGGLAAISYGPCAVRTEIDGETLALEELTDYPFSGTIRFRVAESTLTRSATIRLRIPGWADQYRLAKAGEVIVTTPDQHGFVTLEEQWTTGDEFVLELPMRPRRIRRERQAVGVRLGSLVMVATPGEVWRPLPEARGLGEWEVFPERSWNIALYPDAPVPLERWTVTTVGVGPVPFDRSSVPIRIQAAGCRHLPQWRRDRANAGPIPDGPAPTGWINAIDLVPYGSARVRIAEFPTVVPVTGVELPAGFRGVL
ncbi:MAG: glycoside hydrolase family 127 protein [Propionicimonas sp.]